MKTRSALLIGGLLLLSGCTKRSILRFEDHPIQNKTFVETIRHDNYIITASETHEFWLCDDNDNELSCSRTCNGKSDLACPAVGMSVGISGSNIR